MASEKAPAQVLPVVAAFSRHTDLLDRVRAAAEGRFGPVAAECEFAFTQTAYYERTMGPSLRKRLYAFRGLVDPASLVEHKRWGNALESALAPGHAEERPVNVDPGYLHLGKFVLATMKDNAHRLYLGQGVYAEVTLHYRGGAWEPWPWTYADYRLPEVLAFLGSARAIYRALLAEQPESRDE
jgi:hypothetical protein